MASMHHNDILLIASHTPPVSMGWGGSRAQDSQARAKKHGTELEQQLDKATQRNSDMEKQVEKIRGFEKEREKKMKELEQLAMEKERALQRDLGEMKEMVERKQAAERPARFWYFWVWVFRAWVWVCLLQISALELFEFFWILMWEIQMCMYVCMYVYIPMYVRVCVLDLDMREIRMCVCAWLLCVYMSVTYTCSWIRICICIYMYVCMYIINYYKHVYIYA